MKTRFATLFVTFIACGPANRSTTSNATRSNPAASKSASNAPLDSGDFRPIGNEIDTAAGGEFRLMGANGKRTDNGDSGWTNQSQLSVSYYDQRNYFDGAPISVWAELTIYSQTEDGLWSADRTMTVNGLVLTENSDGDHYGTIDVELGGDSGSAEVLVYGDFAFFSGNKWDSNSGANYHQGELNLF